MTTQVDYWDRQFSYRPVGQVASKGSGGQLHELPAVSQPERMDGSETSDDLTHDRWGNHRGPCRDDPRISGIINETIATYPGLPEVL
jgi:hypothetical protein